MIQSMPSVAQFARARRLTFAYTRPLSPADVSGMTGVLADRQPEPEEPRGLRRVVHAVRELLVRF